MKSFLTQTLKDLEDQHLKRSLLIVEGDQGPLLRHQGRSLINFSSNNYLGLTNHPLMIQASIQATQQGGTGSGASRLITGSMQAHHDFEKNMAAFKGAQACLLFNSGYHANLGIISALLGKGDVVFSDELNHASLIDGCRLSQARIAVYRHNDVSHLKQLLIQYQNAPKKLIVTDTVFSMDGDVCPLKELSILADQYEAWLLVDEAHATGVFGNKGCGVVEATGLDPNHPRLIQMGTLGKALGSFGAYICGSQELIDFLINKSRPFIFTTALPPGVVAASLKALEILQSEPGLKDKLWEHTHYFSEKLKKLASQKGLQVAPTESPIVPLIIGDAAKTMALSQRLFDLGVWAHGIRPPTVPDQTSRIRFTLMATHTREQLDTCLQALSQVLSY